MDRHLSRVSRTSAVFLALLFASAVWAQDIERNTGEWQQFVWSSGRWRALGSFVVERQGDTYQMARAAQATEPVGITKSRGLFDVRFAGSDWTFNSDWGNGRVGTFRL